MLNIAGSGAGFLWCRKEKKPFFSGCAAGFSMTGDFSKFGRMFNPVPDGSFGARAENMKERFKACAAEPCAEEAKEKDECDEEECEEEDCEEDEEGEL